MQKFILKCTECGEEYKDDNFRLRCDNDHGPALLRSVYNKKVLNIRYDNPGMFRYADYLTSLRTIDVEGRHVTFKSEALAEALGLNNLYIIFNG